MRQDEDDRVAEPKGQAAERDRLLAIERERRRRLDALELLLPAIAEVLDVREVFPRLATLVQQVIPHVTVSLALVTPDGGGVRIHVASNFDVGELPEYRFTAEDERIRSSFRSFVAYDCVVVTEGTTRVRTSPPGVEPATFVDLHPGAPWTRILSRLGIRSLLRVPIRIGQEAVGGLSFGADRPEAYCDDDVPLATRIADHVALALAHERLAVQQREAALSRERAEALELRVRTLTAELDARGPHRALGASAAWKQVLTSAARVAQAETTVLLTGESGTGKEVVARYIHRGSPRAERPFVAINCAALPEALLESELFGHERGAFTGAQAARAGKVEQAEGGVLFLDEVAEMAPAVQAKFLRLLQEREFQRIGGSRTHRADVRVIAATNRDPRLAMERGTLREDLYYRLSAFELSLPPLRARRDDILPLAEAFLEELAHVVGRPAAGLSEDARDLLIRHAWPGNVRELRNAVERAVILCEGGLVAREHLPIAVAGGAGPRGLPDVVSPADSGASGPRDLPATGVRLGDVERHLVEQALARARNNKSQAARLLGIPRGQLYSLLRRHGLSEAKR